MPVTDANFDTSSYNQCGEKHFLTKNMMKWFWDNYIKDSKQRQQIHASPLQAMMDQLVGLPPTLIVVAENDVLRDEGGLMVANLDAAGVDVTSVTMA